MHVLRHEAAATGEVQRAFGVRVGGEPVVAVNRLAPCNERRIEILLRATAETMRPWVTTICSPAVATQMRPLK